MLIGTINSVQYLNGSIQGIQGATGNGIASIVLNNDYTLTVNYTDGTSYTSGSIRGATGETGATPSLSMGNVITGAAGSDAQATITGTDTNPVLNLTLPRGETGNVSLEQLYALAIKQSISGEIASFSDGGDNLPMPKCEVTLDPIQDLNGYDAPWVGGVGKNKCPYGTTTSQNNITYTVASNGVVTLSGSAASAENIFAIQFTVAESGNYYFSGCADGGNLSTTYDVFLYDVTNSSRAKKWDGTTNSDSLTNSTTSAECKLTAGTTYQYRIRVRNGFTPSSQKFYPMVRKSTENDTYEPYSNICPISGHDEAEFSVVGKNLYDYSSGLLGIWCSNNVIVTSSNAYSFVIQCKPNTTYTVSKTAGARFQVWYNHEYPNVGTACYGLTVNNGASSITITTDAEARYLCGYVWYATSDAVTKDQMAQSVQVELGSTATTYEAYNGTTYTTALGRTVYGGTLDLVSGVLTVDRAIVDLGTLTWTAISNSRWRSQPISGIKIPSGSEVVSAISDRFVAYSQSAMASDTSVIGVYVDIYGEILVRNGSTVDTPTGQLVYELATPQTYQLTPRQIQTLLGTNNVWANSGDVEVVYIADTKLYVDNH